jgi:hypothetical protein
LLDEAELLLLYLRGSHLQRWLGRHGSLLLLLLLLLLQLLLQQSCVDLTVILVLML